MNLRLLREAKHRALRHLHPARVGLHRALGVLAQGSRTVGSPRYFVCDPTSTGRNDRFPAKRRTATAAAIERHDLLEGEAIIAPSVTVRGTPSDGFRNVAYVRNIREHVTELAGARTFADDYLAVITHEDALVGDYSDWHGFGYTHRIFERLSLPAPERLPGLSLYLRGGSNYYHFLTDTLPKFRLLELAGISLDAFDHILVAQPKTAFEKELLAAFGVPTEKIVDPWQRRHLELERLVVPTVWNRAGRWFVEYLQNRLLPLASHDDEALGASRRLYVSRGGASGRRVVNEDAVFALLSKRYGFEMVRAESLSAREQAALFRQAECVVGPHGAALANALFCRSGTAVLELRAATHVGHTDNCFRELCAYGDLEHHLLFCEGVRQSATAKGHDFDMDVPLPLLEEACGSLLRSAAPGPTPTFAASPIPKDVP